MVQKLQEIENAVKGFLGQNIFPKIWLFSRRLRVE